MGKFRIEGGHPISGTIRASGNKNSALPAVAATLLSEKPTKLTNVPMIGDVLSLFTIIEGMGAEVTLDKEINTAIVDTSSISKTEIKSELCRKLRGSILLAAPLLHRCGVVELPFPGGDRIGRRRIDTHLLALEKLGAKIEIGSGITISAPNGLTGANILLDEASVTATENTVMAAAVAQGRTVIDNAACEPHVQELCLLLRSMGADIEGIGTNRLTVHGVQSLGGGELKIGADYLEVASFMTLAAMTGGELLITDASPEYLPMILHQFKRIGIVADVRGKDLLVHRNQPLEILNDYRGAVPRLDDAPWPGFPADLTSVALVGATRSTGSVIIHEKMFESRLFFVDQLIEMGAQIVLCDPHRAVVIGNSRLQSANITSPDIRAGMALLIASLCAEGTSIIDNIEQIDRGYERIDERLRPLGARIERIS